MHIGVIGGADGPTSILVSGPGFDVVLLIIAGVALAAGFAIYTVRRKGKKR